jgi:hypothetical protein
MKDFVFTFGFGQKHQNGYHVIQATTMREARDDMNRKFGNQWSQVYESKEAAGVKTYGLHEVK